MQEIRPEAQNRGDRLARQAAERFEIPEIKEIMYERVPEDDQLRYYLDTAEQVRDTSELRRFVADDPDDEIAQSLQTATQEIESAVEDRVEEVIERTLEEIRREIPKMIQTRRSGHPHAGASFSEFPQARLKPTRALSRSLSASLASQWPPISG